MTKRYAKRTGVGIERTATEIRNTLRQHGATDVIIQQGETMGAVAFLLAGRRMAFRLTMPAQMDPAFILTEQTKKTRSAEAAHRLWEQACRERWRGLALLIKAKLVAVDAGIVESEAEFFGNVVVPGDERTMSEALRQPLALAYEKRHAGPLLPYLGGGDDNR